MKKIYLIFTLLMFFFTLPSVKAECNTNEINFKDYINIETSNNQEKTEGILTIEIKLNSTINLNVIPDKRLQCDINQDKKIECRTNEFGKYTITIKGKPNNCDKEIKKEYKIDLKKENKYYKNELCNGIEEFVLCQKYYDKDINYDDFLKRINLYKKSKVKSENNENIIKKDNKNLIITFFKTNIINIIIGIIFSLLLIVSMVLVIKDVKKRRRLE